MIIPGRRRVYERIRQKLIAKGGIALAIAHDLGIPVKLIGIGEKLEDLRPFEAAEFARALVS